MNSAINAAVSKTQNRTKGPASLPTVAAHEPRQLVYPLTVVGIGASGATDLPAETLTRIREAKILVGGRRHLGLFKGVGRENIPIEGDLNKVFSKIRNRFAREKTVILASGDPLYFGIGDFLRRNVSGAQMVVIPHVGSVQLAFARIKESWHDARVVSLHGRPMSHLYPALNEGANKIAVFTDEKNHPAAIARELLSLGITDATLHVLENLGTDREKVTTLGVNQWQGKKFSPLNILIIMREGAGKEHALPVMGLPDDFFEKRIVRVGMITKEEIRVLALAKLSLKPGMTLWDIGACTGSVSIEAKRLCPSLSVWAIEKNVEDVARLRRNARRALAGPLQVLHGKAPGILERIDENPHRVFIGGHGGALKAILAAVDKRLQSRGRIVINAILEETVQTAEDFFKRRSYTYEIIRVNIAKRNGPETSVQILYGQKKN